MNGGARKNGGAHKPTGVNGSTTGKDREAAPRLFGVPMKWLSLVALTFQTSWQVFVFKFARAGGTKYMNTSVVLFAEVLKTVLSILFAGLEQGSVLGGLPVLRRQLTRNPLEALKFSVPALAYTIMNNLIMFSLEKLSAPVQQVTYQLKILTAAILSVVMLGKTVRPLQWFALVLLIVGVVLVQWPRDPAQAFSSHDGQSLTSPDALIGFAAVLLATVMGGFGGVYMEMMLKQAGSSIWLRNAQLGIFGTLTAIFGALSQENASVSGLTQGFTWRVGLAVFTLASGGLLVAVVIRYADNILRQFSTALSIILTSLMSAVVLQEFVPDALFVLGTVLAISATFLYNLGLPHFLAGLLEKRHSE